MNTKHIFVGTRLTVDAISPAQWRVVFDNAPINLYDPEMFAELRLLLDRMEGDPSLRVVVFESANPNYFIAHWDIARGHELPDVPGAAPFTEWPAFVTRLSKSKVVSIAKIRGRARGHGSELALACDMRFASRENAILCQMEVGFGVVPGGGAMEWLAHFSGRARAMEIVLGADDFDADTAERYGWINRSIPDAQLDIFVDRLAGRIASFDSRALELAKTTIDARLPVAVEADRQASNRAFLQAAAWPELHERRSAAFAAGLQQDSDVEWNLGEYVGRLGAIR